MNRRDFLASIAAYALQPGAQVDGALPSSWALDADGSGVLDAADRAIVEAAVGAVRGFGPRPAPGYDFRADLLGRGIVTFEDLDLFDRRVRPGPISPRPIVACWHYGWYHPQRRVLEPTTTSYVGGDYNSDDPTIEDDFNALKNEFGITADLLSWIPRGAGGLAAPNDNYRSGYFAAPSVATRRYGWLYETSINLDLNGPSEISDREGRRAILVDNFREMARMMLDPATGSIAGNVLRIDGRPVIFMFASHLMGRSARTLVDVVISLSRARLAFQEVAGVPPYLIGDETLFFGEDRLDLGRRLRAPFFDAVTRYHHYEAARVARFAGLRPVRMGGDYLGAVVAHEARNEEVFAGIVNRFTGRPLLVIPSSAAGFAKVGLPTLHASRADYALLLGEMQGIADGHIDRLHRDVLGTPVLPAPIVIAGSWNEEFEGHALFPAQSNAAMVRAGQGGFEWLFALKETYGWNHNVASAETAGPAEGTPGESAQDDLGGLRGLDRERS